MTAVAPDPTVAPRAPDDDAAKQAPAARASLRPRQHLSRLLSSLPAKLLMLTAAFVMLAEVLIFVPSVANFRIGWMNDRLTAARLASLAAEAAPGGVVPAMLRQNLLMTAEVKAVAIRKVGIRRMILPPEQPMAIQATYDLRPMASGDMMTGLSERIWLIGEAIAVFFRDGDRLIRIVGPLEAASQSEDFIEIVVPEKPMREAMLRYGFNILLLSIFISLLTAALVYIALSGLLVRPMMRISDNMLRFSENPDDASRIIIPSTRSDEIGTTERELADMQRQVVTLSQQKNRLAQLGLAVSKINHDLRNMLASAQLLSDRLSAVPDPTVQRFAPKLIASLDRAINFCNDTLKFGRAEEATPRRQVMLLAPLVDEIGAALGLPRDGALRFSENAPLRLDWQANVPDTLMIDADPDHLYRILNNLARNAMQALESSGPGAAAAEGDPACITVTARREQRRVIIELRDNGPGLPPRARENLFRAFKGSVRAGGTGLGLVIASELASAHGGSLTLIDTPDGTGAAFEIVIPDRMTT